MTTHQMAKALLDLPDVPLVIEGWCVMDNHEMTASITEYDDEVAIIWQKPDPRLPERTSVECAEWRWLNIPTQLPKTP